MAGLLLGVAALSAAGTWAARAYAVRRRLFDAPGERRSHANATPRGGGVAILGAMLLVLSALATWRFLDPASAANALEPGLLVSFALGLLLVGGIGWVDDHRPLSPWSRLAIHAIASLQLAAAAAWATGDPVATAVALLAPLVLANVWNFMDGIDGIAATQAILVALAFAAWLPGDAALVAAALAVACLGFLPFNFPKARIFMGDVGSGALGFALGALASWLPLRPHGDGPAMALLALLPLSAFLLDAALTLARRILDGESWWEPHVTHAYQRLSRRFGRHWPVTALYGVFTLGAAAMALVLATGREAPGLRAVIMALLAWYALGAALWIAVQRGGMSRRRENRE